MDIQYLVLSPGLEPEPRHGPLTYDQIVETVGYPVEVINLEGRAVMYVCEEGKQREWPHNPAATKIAAPNLRSDDSGVVGTALIVGPLGPGGTDTTLPDDVMRDLIAQVMP